MAFSKGLQNDPVVFDVMTLRPFPVSSIPPLEVTWTYVFELNHRDALTYVVVLALFLGVCSLYIFFLGLVRH